MPEGHVDMFCDNKAAIGAISTKGEHIDVSYILCMIW